MTKTVRVENADSNTEQRLRVTRQVMNENGEWKNAETYDMPLPTTLLTLTVYKMSRLIVEEY